MLPNPYEKTEEGSPRVGDKQLCSLQQMEEWRQDQLAWQQWRWDAATEEQYRDNNQFTQADKNEMSQNGVPMITINRVSHQINEVIGIQRSNITDLKLTSEEVSAQDATDALNVKLHEAERYSDFRKARLEAAKCAATIGIGFYEIGREADPFKAPIKCRQVPWREMQFDYRNGPDIEDWAYTKRGKFYHVDRLKAHFKGVGDKIEQSSWSNDNFRQWIDIDQLYRQYDGRNWRDVPLSWNWTPQSQKYYRLLEELFYQVQIEGVIVRLENGRVMAWEDCKDNPMIQLALQNDQAGLEEACYTRWRRAYWINDVCLQDEWSPLPFNENPYTPIWCYREEQTGVPYGLVRVLRSIQDAINTFEARMQLSVAAKEVWFEEGAVDPVILQQQIGRKNCLLPIKPGFWEKIKKQEHTQLSETEFKVYQDLLVQIETVGGTSGLNPAATGTKPRSGVLASTLLAQAMSALGEFQGNCSEAAERGGRQLTELVREGIASRGNVPVRVTSPAGKKKKVYLHQRIGDDETGIITNDITLLNAEVAVEEVPHTATYRAAQLDNLAIALQSLPPDDPMLIKVRCMLTGLMLRCMDIPGAQEMSQQVLEALGVSPPETPEEQAQAEQKAQDDALQKQLTVEGAKAKIGRDQAAANKDNAQAAHHQALAQSESQPDPLANVERELDIAKTSQQVHQIASKTAHTQSLTALTLHKANGEAQENARTAEPPPLPEQW